MEWTNNFYEAEHRAGRGSRDWFPEGVSRSHIYKLKATLILNGIHPYPSLRKYWELDGFAFNDSTIMNMWGGNKGGYRHVENLKAYLRYAPPPEDPTAQQEDIFFKTRPLTDMLCSACESAFQVGEHISLDEIDISCQYRFRGSRLALNADLLADSKKL